ncbi:hypothetical protein GGX14DRAFT_642845 [Mycena pura]|uniref:Uncharacterized protein n=1 Tax=Mycena pura TaxID=153505 RepID=A0AAD7E3E0_9AGAR|nr:hypothetical protein GGX14DRAFT_642845 [Mycena pura]
MTASNTNAISTTTAETVVLSVGSPFPSVHTLSKEGGVVTMDNSGDNKSKCVNEVILVPSELYSRAESDQISYTPDADTKSAHTRAADDDQITLHVEGPAEPESLSSSTVTADSSTLLASASSSSSSLDPEAEADATDADADADACSDVDADASDPGPRRPRVRFRSRVRIASGLHHHHRRRLSTTSTPASASASVSSLSSSVSAPLRSPPTLETSTPGWGTLGTRVGLFAHAKQGRGRRRGGAGLVAASERTALLGNSGKRRRHAARAEGSDDEEREGGAEDIDDEALLSRQIDLVFGRWPWRLFNRLWWSWQLQPILCCGCLDEVDGED